MSHFEIAFTIVFQIPCDNSVLIINYSLFQVSITDTLPLQLCYQCASTLIAWDNMITSCIEADKKLRAMQEAAEEELKNTEVSFPFEFFEIDFRYS